MGRPDNVGTASDDPMQALNNIRGTARNREQAQDDDMMAALLARMGD